jgi:hypothetical protein
MSTVSCVGARTVTSVTAASLATNSATVWPGCPVTQPRPRTQASSGKPLPNQAP